MNEGLSPLRLPARTESGRSLGSVVDVTIDPQTQSVVAYHIKPNRLVPDVVWSPLIVHYTQVVRISAREIVVDDGVVTQRQNQPTPQPTS